LNASEILPFGLGRSITLGFWLDNVDGMGSIQNRHQQKSTKAKNKPATSALWGSIIRSMIDDVRNEPNRVNDVPFGVYSTVTLQSRSRFCFLSRHSWKAQPRAWLNRSP
jgi:hypothetical protein